MDRLTITLENVHCDDCAASIRAGLLSLFDLNDETLSVVGEGSAKPAVSYLLNENEVVLASGAGILNKAQKDVVDALELRGFEVVSVELNSDNPLSTTSIWDPLTKIIRTTKHKATSDKRHKAHLQNCVVCQNLQEHLPEPERKSIFRKVFTSSDSSSDNDTLVNADPYDVVVKNTAEYRAVIAINDMASDEDCSKIKTLIENILNSLKVLASSDTVSLSASTRTAVVIIPNQQIANHLLSLIKDLGFSLSLSELLPIEMSKKYKVTAAIGGMTCAACSSAIENLVRELPFVVESAINVVSKNGIFVIDSSSKNDLDQLTETVEDVGYDFEIMDVAEVNHAAKKITSRTVNLKIDGMFCEHCPEEINEYLSQFGESVVVNDPITLLHPFVRFTYIPSPPEITIRKLLDDIDELSPNFKVELIKGVSLEEHLKKMAHRDTMVVAKRLLLSTIVAIPTFIIGIVFMSLLPSHHHLRMWAMEPIWAGNVSRAVWLLFIMATVIYLFADDIFHKKAIKEIRTLWNPNVSWKRRLFKFGSMSLLMSLGTTVAYFSSLALLILSAHSGRNSEGFTTTYFDSVVFLTFFLLIGRLLEAFSKSKTAEAVTRLSNVKPQKANLVERILTEDGSLSFGSDQQIKLELLEIGDYIRVAPGESPSADSIVIQGESQFDESALTGESVPVLHTPGEQVFTGTVNTGKNSVICKIIALDGSSLIDQIVNAVRDGQLKRAPIERTADTLTGIFVPIICALAVITWVIWISLGYSHSLPESYLDIDIGGWCIWSMEFAIAVFVVACPCGIGLAAPTALFVGSGLAAKYGILARGGGAAFQEGARVDVACFDKTGTLTTGGDPKVTEYSFLNLKEDDMLMQLMIFQITRDMELSSRHPLAIAVRNFAISESLKNGFKTTSNIVPEVEEVPGKGLIGDIIIDLTSDNSWKDMKPESAIIGNEKLLNDNQSHVLSERQKLTLMLWKKEGKSVVIVAIKCESYFGKKSYVPVLMMSARDQIRPEAKNVISTLEKQGITCWMISGDNLVTANAIAKQLGISNVVSEVLPEEKALKIEWIQKTFFSEGKEGQSKRAIVAMVGDGINDAPALAAADVGIALASGSDLALTSSDFVLLAPHHPLISLLNLLSLSKAVFRRVKFNFGWAIVYNAIGIPIAAGVIYPYQNSRLSPVWASAAMAASSVSVVLSSLALRLYRPPKVEMEDTTLDHQELQLVLC